ncbi:hypothetical protein O181_034732 [Austropuccinia psidii MF-1]|uniref:Charged multivesicular body protein 7 n=1 Tax=Austropuccinia psidii MF-1 TaxID=1389203 RepID=A0A9Q3D777_9BASI|nr:hypothetical protein [Austropuccinia psidii MF-1]
MSIASIVEQPDGTDLNYGSIISQTVQLGSYLGQSPQQREQFVTAVRLFHDDIKSNMLLTNVCTRWNSTYIMLECALSLKEAYNQFCAPANMEQYHLTLLKWDKFSFMINFLQPLDEATGIICGSKYPTIKYALPLYISLIRHIHQFAQKEWPLAPLLTGSPEGNPRLASSGGHPPWDLLRPARLERIWALSAEPNGQQELSPNPRDHSFPKSRLHPRQQQIHTESFHRVLVSCKKSFMMIIDVSNDIMDHLKTQPEFKSQDRIESLYSDFTSAKHSNPAGFQSNNSFWARIVGDILRLGLQPTQSDSNQPPDRLVLHFNDELFESFRIPVIGKPFGLCCSIWSLSSFSLPRSDAIFTPISTFYSTLGWSDHSTGFGQSLLRSISWASINLFGASYFDPHHKFQQLDLQQKFSAVKIDWVNLPLLYDVADRVIELYEKNFIGLSPSIDCLFTYSQFQDQLTKELFPSSKFSSQLSKPDLNVLIKHLERDRRVLSSEAGTIKFILPQFLQTNRFGRRSSKIDPPSINETDRGILSVKQTLYQLTHQIQILEAQIDHRTTAARKYVQKSQPKLAASHLKARASLKEVLDRRLGSLDTLQKVYMKIEQASTDVEIMAAYETSTGTLKKLLSNPTLNFNHVEHTIDNLHEVLADMKEIDETIEMGNKAGDSMMDEEELATELAKLVSTEKPEEASSVMDDLEGRLRNLAVPQDSSINLPSTSNNPNQASAVQEDSPVLAS